MADLQQLEEQIVGLSLLDAAALVKKLEERLGVSAAAAAPVMVAGGGGAAAGAAAAEEKTEFAVVLKEVGANKPRTWWMAPPRPSKRASIRTRPRTSGRNSPRPERRSK
jgi:hypothetical protein